MTTVPAWAPPLPTPRLARMHDGDWTFFDEDQLRDYALAAVEAYKASLKPAAWAGSSGGLHKHPQPGTKPLYRLDDQQ